MEMIKRFIARLLGITVSTLTNEEQRRFVLEVAIESVLNAGRSQGEVDDYVDMLNQPLELAGGPILFTLSKRVIAFERVRLRSDIQEQKVLLVDILGDLERVNKKIANKFSKIK